MIAVATTSPAAPIRSWRERLLQTFAYEAGGLLVISPLWSALSGAAAFDSIALLVSLSVAVMSWTAIFNTLFDMVEARTAGRAASDRPNRWRVVHAVGLEVTSVLVTTPVVAFVTGYGWLEALFLDIGLGVAYAAYGYVFHLCFDRLRPVRAAVGFPGGNTA